MSAPDSEVAVMVTPERPAVSFIVPCHNEELVVETAAQALLELIEQQHAIGRCGPGSLVLLVDDGSSDRTWALIEQLSKAHPGRIAGLLLSRNVGHQHALLAGLSIAPGDVLISIDADLQDDLSVIPQMLDYYQQGNDIVYGVRRGRPTDTRLKRLTAAWFYRLMRRLGVDVIDNHADYRLMSRRAVEILRQYDEVNLFLRGIVRLIGLRSAQVLYDRRERVAGSTKYSLSRRCSGLAIDGGHVVLGGTAARDLGAGSADLAVCTGGERLGAGGRADQSVGGAGLGLDRTAGHLHWRGADPLDRRARRVHRQDLHGDQAPAALYRRSHRSVCLGDEDADEGADQD